MNQREAEELMRQCAHSMPPSDFGSFRAIKAAAKVLVAAVEKEREANFAQVNGLKNVLDEILDYRGGADNALDDPYVMDRARAALADARRWMA